MSLQKFDHNQGAERRILWLAAMIRASSFSIRLLAYLFLCNCTLAAPLNKADLVGTYHIDTSSFHLSGDETLPTNFWAFAITLNADGSFVATNVFPDCFFSFIPTPATPNARGSWDLRHESDGGSLFYTGETDYLTLDFTTVPGPGRYSTQIERYRSRLRIRMDYKSGKKYIATFYLQK